MRIFAVVPVFFEHITLVTWILTIATEWQLPSQKRLKPIKWKQLMAPKDITDVALFNVDVLLSGVTWSLLGFKDGLLPSYFMINAYA